MSDMQGTKEPPKTKPGEFFDKELERYGQAKNKISLWKM